MSRTRSIAAVAGFAALTFAASKAGLDGLTFGLIDNGVLIAGAYLGFDLGERLGAGRGRLGAVLGAGIGNTVSDGLGALMDPTMASAVVGIAMGCLLPLILIPACESIADAINSDKETA